MNSRPARRAGRQIPADLLILSVGSLSAILGFPIARALRFYFPLVDKWICLIVGIGMGFLVLLVVYRLLEAALSWWLRERD